MAVRITDPVSVIISSSLLKMYPAAICYVLCVHRNVIVFRTHIILLSGQSGGGGMASLHFVLVLIFHHVTNYFIQICHSP